MPQSKVDIFNSVVRPAITTALVRAQIAFGVMWATGAPHAEQASGMLGPFTMMAVTFWFKSRDDKDPPQNA